MFIRVNLVSSMQMLIMNMIMVRIKGKTIVKIKLYNIIFCGKLICS